MDLAKIIHMLLTQQGGVDGGQPDYSMGDPGMYQAPPEIASDSLGYPPQWHMAEKNSQLHDLLFPQDSGGSLGTPPNHNTAQQYDDYKKILLLDQLHRRINVMKRYNQM